LVVGAPGNGWESARGDGPRGGGGRRVYSSESRRAVSHGHHERRRGSRGDVGIAAGGHAESTLERRGTRGAVDDRGIA
jgi:hypothetical protein